MIREAVEVETIFSRDVLSQGVAGMGMQDLRTYLEYVADRRLESLGIAPIYGARNPFPFMELQDVQELANFFERRVSAYQVGVTGDVVFVIVCRIHSTSVTMANRSQRPMCSMLTLKSSHIAPGSIPETSASTW